MKQAYLLLAIALVLTGCAKNIDNKEAVQSAVSQYVSGKGINVAQMRVNVDSVSFHGNQADATVAFVPTGGGSGVTAKYQLERVQDRWQVKGRSTMQSLDHNGAGVPGADMTGGPTPGHPNNDGTVGSKQ